MKKKLLIIFVCLTGLFVWFLYLLTNPVLSQKVMLFKKNKNTSPNPQTEIPALKERLYETVKVLTEIKPARNSYNIPSLEKAAAYIKKEFETLGLDTEEQKYLTPDKNIYKNIIARYGNKTDEIIVIGAHYDVCGDQDGADDNASAVAGLLEIARLVAELKPDLKYQLEFVAYSLEEPPYFATPYMGSAVHAKNLKDEGIEVKAMICLEMIGYFTDEPKSQTYPISALKVIYPSVGNFIAVVGNFSQGKLTRHMKKYMLQGGNIPVYSINAPKMMTGIDFSDHRNYWALGYPAVMINNTSFYRNKNYHQATDTIDTLDFDKMTEVVKGVYWAIANFK